MIKNLDLKNLLIYSHWLLVLWKMVCIFVSFDNAFKTTLKRETFNFYLKEFISFLKLKDKPVFQYFHRIMEESWKCFNTTLLLTVMAVFCFVFFFRCWIVKVITFQELMIMCMIIKKKKISKLCYVYAI